MKKIAAVLSCIIGLILLMTGCQSKSPYDDYEKITMNASWSYNYGSVEELSKSGDIAAVVKITGAESELLNGIRFTTYDAQIEELVAGTNEDSIKIVMTGGIDDTEKKIYELADDPLMKLNDEFLIFAKQNQDGTYTILSGPQGRFEIKNNHVYSLNESNAQVKKANVGSNIKVNGENKDEFFKAVRKYAG